MTWRTRTVLMAFAVGAPLALGGGGGVDNDSPFGAPKHAGGTPDNPPPAFSSGGSACDGMLLANVHVATGGTFKLGSLKLMSSELHVAGPLVLEGDPESLCDDANEGELATGAEIRVPAGHSARAAAITGGIALQGSFELKSELPIVLRTSQKSMSQIAFLAVGTLTPAGVFVPERVVSVPLEGDKLDVTALRKSVMAAADLLEGKVARIHLFGLVLDLDSGGKAINEGRVTFAIRAGSAMQVDTTAMPILP